MRNIFKSFKCDASKGCCKYCDSIRKIVKISLISFVVSTVTLFVLGPIVVKGVISHDPKSVVLDPIEKMMMDREKDAQKDAGKKAVEIFNGIKNDNRYGFIGANVDDKIVVEFFDYNCGYCGMQSAEFKKLMKKRSDIKYILVDFPIMSQTSYEAAAVAVHLNQVNPKALDTYYDYLSKSKAKDSNSVKLALSAAKIQDPDSLLKKAVASEEVKSFIKNNYKLAKDLNLQGTPALIINGKLTPGYLKAEEIEKQLDA